ncbi:hypothetical protein AAMO2058_001145100 [Amorphochlora amoebiformis]
MEKKQSNLGNGMGCRCNYHRSKHPAFSAQAGSGVPSMNLKKVDIPEQICRMMDVQGSYQKHLAGLPLPSTLDGSRGNQAQTMDPYMPITANQVSQVQETQHLPSLMSVLEPAQGGLSLVPSVKALSLVSLTSYAGFHGQLPNVHERKKIPSMHPQGTILPVDPHISYLVDLLLQGYCNCVIEPQTVRVHQQGRRNRQKQKNLTVAPLKLHAEPLTRCQNHMPNFDPRTHNRAISLEEEPKKIPRPKKKKKKADTKHKSHCHWCQAVCISGLSRHMEKCEDGLFEAACYTIRWMFGNSRYKLKRDDIKKAYIAIIKSTEIKSEVMSRIKERMTNRIKQKIAHTVRAPPNNMPGYKAFQGLDAMICLFFQLFGLEMPVPAGLESYNFTGFDAEISARVKEIILKWIQMRKNAGRDGLNATAQTSQDSLPNGGALVDTKCDLQRDGDGDLKDIGSMVKKFELRLLDLAPTEKFTWLRCFLVTLRGFSAEALELKTLPNGEIRYRSFLSPERKGILGSMWTFVKQNYDKLVECFRDVVASEDHATELRLQLLRAILAMPSDRRASHLITLTEELVRRLSEDVPDRFSSLFGDVPQITYVSILSPSQTLSIAESAQADLCHFVHVQGSRSSTMCLVNSDKGILKPISEGQNNLHSTALDLFINRGLSPKAVLSLPDFMYIANLIHTQGLVQLSLIYISNSQTLRITSNEQWKAMSLETRSASEFAKLDALIITKCAIPELEIGTLKMFQDLRCLRLVGNDISTLQPGVFDHLSRLEILDLSFNSLTSIPSGVRNAGKSLRELRLDGNYICILSPKAFEGLSNLKILTLGSNQLHTLAEGAFHGLESLEKLSLWNNKLKRLSVGLFQTLKSLRNLDLSDNKLQSLDKGTFDDLKSLRELDLHLNQLQSLDKGTFDHLKSLGELDLSYNQLQSLDKGMFDILRSLTELDLHLNQLHSLDRRAFDDLKSLTKLDLSYNQLQSLNTGTFHDLKSLKFLNLNYNQLQGLDKGTFDNLKSLELLDLSSNHLQSLEKETFGDLKSLRKLYLKNNQLQSIDKGTFDDLKSLMKLDLSSNQLQSLGKGTFDDLKSLKYVYLLSNPLDYTQIDATTFDSLNGVKTFPDLSTIRNRMVGSFNQTHRVVFLDSSQLCQYCCFYVAQSPRG